MTPGLTFEAILGVLVLILASPSAPLPLVDHDFLGFVDFGDLVNIAFFEIKVVALVLPDLLREINLPIDLSFELISLLVPQFLPKNSKIKTEKNQFSTKKINKE